MSGKVIFNSGVLNAHSSPRAVNDPYVAKVLKDQQAQLYAVKGRGREGDDDGGTKRNKNNDMKMGTGGKRGSRRRSRSLPKSSRKFKKSAKRVFRKKSRSTRRR
jgi:hypothetical protein